MSIFLLLHPHFDLPNIVGHMQDTNFQDLGSVMESHVGHIQHLVTNPAQLKHEIAEHLVMEAGSDEDATMAIIDQFVDDAEISADPQRVAAKIASLLTALNDPQKIRSIGPLTKKRLLRDLEAAERYRDSPFLSQVRFDAKNQIDAQLRMSPTERMAFSIQMMSAAERQQHENTTNYDLSDFAPK